RAYGQAVSGLGFTHILAFDHVLGADPTVHAPWTGPYDVATTFHEPFVMFGFLAAITQLELVTGVVILPQRQTALAAKQAAEVDLLTSGRFRFGVGIGWNPVEYEALGQRFDRRGRRLEEQVELLRALWTTPSLTFSGEFHRVTGAGLAPLPVQRPIPIWMGGNSSAAHRRIGRMADGWFPLIRPGADLDAALDTVRAAAVNAGRDPAAIGMEGQVIWDPDDVERFVRQVGKWSDAGATHLCVNTMGLGLASVDEHVVALEAVSSALGLH
ncbi:MAG TPA: LLM class F420-dependent oxidoreductase, partial [Mycobacteriales bacterium]|nr:LLM class F420-dependent oxidoreductase [Mycobacteriales bacterium]